MLEVAEESQRELERMTQELVRLLTRYRNGEVEWREVQEFQQQLRWLYEDTLVASDLIGMFTPWQPDQPPLTKALSIGAIFDRFFGTRSKPKKDKWRWPQLQNAVDWLRENSIVGYDDLNRVVNNARENVFVSGTLTDPLVIAQVKDAVTESINQGDSLHTFRNRISEFIDRPKAETETIFRTNTKRAYLAGQDRILKVPAVKKVITCVLFRATRDGRVRPEHLAMHDWIAEVDSPLHQLFVKMQSDYNCRCGLIPVSERRLAGRQIRTIDEVPAEIRSQYGV